MSLDLIKFRASPEIRRALRLRAAQDDTDMTDVIIESLIIYLRPQFQELTNAGILTALPTFTRTTHSSKIVAAKRRRKNDRSERRRGI